MALTKTPIPVDDGGCDHLAGIDLPDLELISTEGTLINLSILAGITVVYIYPLTGRPDVHAPGNWNQIPGAKGCTVQSCAFRDHYQELSDLNVDVFGLSSQPTDYQQEAAARLLLPFPLLSDEALSFSNALSLPTMDVEGRKLIKRITLVCCKGIIKKVFYPVFPPEENASEVIDYLSD